MIKIDRLTVTSLHLELFFDTTYLSSATGFVIKKEDKYYLVTNWHVVSGKHPQTHKLLSLKGSIPNKIRIWHNQKDKLGSWVAKDYPLQGSQGNLWKEIDSGRDKVDVIIFPFEDSEDISIYPLDLNLKDVDLLIFPSEDLTIIGFPYGKASDGKFAIWKSGSLASDYDINYDNKPVFLIDATTKGGMSGSPVFAIRTGQVRSSVGLTIGPSATRFLGVYSGRITGDDIEDIPDIGLVWKTSVLDELLRL